MQSSTLLTSSPNTTLQQRFLSTLKEAGYSRTKPRQHVFDTLASRPMTASRVAKDLTSLVDKASVYRTIQVFEHIGIINRIRQKEGYYFELSEVFIPHHHHAVCQSCGAVADFSSAEIEIMLSSIAKSHGFLAVEHSLEISGYCSECSS